MLVSVMLLRTGCETAARDLRPPESFDTPEQIVIRERINCVNSLAHWQIITESESIKEPRGRSRSQSYSQIALLHSHLFLHDQLTFADISGTDIHPRAGKACATSSETSGRLGTAE